MATPDRNTIDADDGTTTSTDPSSTPLTAHALHTLRAAAHHGPSEDLADRLCAAAVTLLGADGASMAAAYTPIMSVPVGASDPHAATAEQVQFTAGEGPCLHAHLTRGTALITDVADFDAVGRRYWPAYTLLLSRTTTFRSVIAVPVPEPDRLGPGPPTPSPTPLPPGPPRDRAGARCGPHTQVPLVRVPLVLTCYFQHPVTVPRTTTDAAAEAATHALQTMLRRIETVSAALGVALAEVISATPNAEPD